MTMSYFDDDEGFLPPTGGGTAPKDKPVAPNKPTDESDLFSDGSAFIDGKGNEATPPAPKPGDTKGNIDPSEWTGDFEEPPTVPEAPKPKDDTPPQDALSSSLTPVTGFNQQHIRLGRAIDELIGEKARKQDNTPLTLGDIVSRTDKKLTYRSLTNLFTQGQADNANTFRSFFFDSYLLKLNPAFKRFEKENGHTPHLQLKVTLRHRVYGELDKLLKDEVVNSFTAHQEGFQYFYPSLHTWALSRKRIIENMEFDTAKGKQTVTVFGRLGGAEKYIDAKGNELSITSYKEITHKQDEGIANKRSFKMDVEAYVQASILQRKYVTKVIAVDSPDESAYLKADPRVPASSLEAFLRQKQKEEASSIVQYDNPSHEEIYQEYRPTPWMPTISECATLYGYGDEKNRHEIVIEYEPLYADEVSRFEHLTRALSTDKITQFGKVEVSSLKALPTPDKDDGTNTQAKVKVWLKGKDAALEDEVGIQYKRALPVTGPYLDIIQNSLLRSDLTADNLQRPSVHYGDPRYQQLKETDTEALVLKEKYQDNQQYSHQVKNMHSYQGIPAYPEVMKDMKPEILPFVFKDLIPGHYTVVSTMDEIKQTKSVKLRAKPGSPIYQGEAVSKVKVFSTPEHMLNSILTGFANTDAIFKDGITATASTWETRFDLDKVGLFGYRFSPYEYTDKDQTGWYANGQFMPADDLPLNYHYLRRLPTFFNHPDVQATFGDRHDNGKAIRHTGTTLNAKIIRGTWGIQHTRLLNYTPYYYRKPANKSFKESLFNNLKEEKRLTADYPLQVNEDNTGFTGHLDVNHPGVKYKGDVVADAFHLSTLVDNNSPMGKVPLTRVEAPNGKVYYYPNVDAKYGQKDLRFSAFAAYAHTLNGEQLIDEHTRMGQYTHPFDIHEANNTTNRYDWLFSGVYLKDYSLKAISDYINAPSVYHNRHRTLFDARVKEESNYTGKDGFMANMISRFTEIIDLGYRDTLVEKVLDLSSTNYVGHPYFDQSILVDDPKETGKVRLADTRVLLNKIDQYLGYGIRGYAWASANSGDKDSEYIRYMLDRSLAYRFVKDHTYLSDWLNQSAYQRLPQYIHIHDTPESRHLDISALPNMAFYQSKINYSAGNTIHQLRWRNFEKDNNTGHRITPVQIGAVKVITKDDDAKLSDKFTMGYVKPHLLESLVLSVKEKKDYRIHGVHRSASGIYKEDNYWFTSSLLEDSYQIESPTKGNKGYARLNITMPEVEFLNLITQLTENKVTYTVNRNNAKLVTFNNVSDYFATKAIIRDVVAKFVKDYFYKQTGWNETDVPLEVEVLDQSAAESISAVYPKVGRFTTIDDVYDERVRPSDPQSSPTVWDILFGLGQSITNMGSYSNRHQVTGIEVEKGHYRLNNLLVKVKVPQSHYLYGEAYLVLNMGVAGSDLNLARMVRNLPQLTPGSFLRYNGYDIGRGYDFRSMMVSVGNNELSNLNNINGKYGHSPQAQVLANHITRQFNPHSDILHDYDLADKCPIYADLTDLNYPFNYSDYVMDDSLSDPFVPAILHRYVSPEVRNYLRVRGYEFANKEWKQSTYQLVTRPNPDFYYGLRRDDKYIPTEGWYPIYYLDRINLGFMFIDKWSNLYDEESQHLRKDGTEPNQTATGFTTAAGGWTPYAQYGDANDLNYYGYLSDWRFATMVFNRMTLNNDKSSGIVALSSRLGFGNPIEYLNNPKRQKVLLPDGYTPSVYLAERYGYIVEYSENIKVAVYLDAAKVDAKLNEALEANKDEDTTPKMVVAPKQEKEEVVDNKVTRKFFNDRYYYDLKSLSIPDYIDLLRYGHTKDLVIYTQSQSNQNYLAQVTTYAYQQTLINRKLNHYSKQAIWQNIGRYIMRLKRYDASVTQSDKTIVFFENKFRAFLLEIGYFYISRLVDTRHLWSGVETYTTPETTFQQVNFKSNALVWFDLPAYVDILTMVFPGIVDENDTNVFNAFVSVLKERYNFADESFLKDLLVSRKEDILPYALMYTRRDIPNFDYYVTLGMTKNQRERLFKDPTDFEKHPENYTDMWTYKEDLAFGDFWTEPRIGGDFRGMVTPVVNKVWKKRVDDKGNPLRTYRLVDNLNSKGQLPNLDNWPNIDDNYEFNKFRTSLDMFGLDRVVGVAQERGPKGRNYQQLVVDEDMLLITNRDDMKHIVTVGSNSRRAMLNRIVPNNSLADVGSDGLNEVHLAKVLQSGNGNFTSSFRLVPAANHPLYYGEGTVTYNVKESPSPSINTKRYYDKVWLNTTMPDYRTLLGQGVLELERKYAREIWQTTNDAQENPNLVTPREEEFNASGPMRQNLAGIRHRYRHASDHMLPWAARGLFIAEDVNYIAAIHLLNKLNQDFNDSQFREIWTYDFLRFMNPGYQTGSIPFITLGYNQLRRMIGFTILDHKNIRFVSDGVRRGELARWHLNDLVGKWSGNELYNAIYNRSKGNPVGKLTPVQIGANINVNAKERFVEDEVGQVFRRYDDGSLRLVSDAVGDMLDIRRKARNPDRIPFTANIGTYTDYANPTDIGNNKAIMGQGWESNYDAPRLMSLTPQEKAAYYEELNKAIEAKDASKARQLVDNFSPLVEEVGYLEGTRWRASIAPPAANDGFLTSIRYTPHEENAFEQGGVTNYAVDLPAGQIDYERITSNIKDLRGLGGINITPALLGLHTIETLRDYRFTRRIPTTFSRQGSNDQQYEIRSYKLSDKTINLILSGKLINPAYFQVMEVRDERYFEEYTPKAGIEISEANRLLPFARKANKPLLTLYSDTIYTSMYTSKQREEELKDAFGEGDKFTVSRKVEQLVPFYKTLHAPTTDKPLLDTLSRENNISGGLPFIPSSLSTDVMKDEHIRNLPGKWGQGNQYNHYKNTDGTDAEGNRSFGFPIAIRGFYSELTYNHPTMVLNENSHLGEYIKDDVLKKTIKDVHKHAANHLSYPLHGMLPKFLGIITATDKVPAWGSGNKTKAEEELEKAKEAKEGE
jgi:hypothetical protein